MVGQAGRENGSGINAIGCWVRCDEFEQVFLICVMSGWSVLMII